MCAGNFTEFTAAQCIESKAYDRLSFLERHSGISQIFTADNRFSDNHILSAFQTVHNFRCFTDFSATGLFNRSCFINQVKRHFCCFTEQNFNAFRILHTRQLNQNSVRTLSLNNRFFCSQFVNTATNNPDRLVNNLIFEFVNSLLVIIYDNKVFAFGTVNSLQTGI